MKMKFTTLTLQCRKSREIIRFSPRISFFHGQISSGKSSIVRLIDFCLGGSLERTPALGQELVSVQLSAIIRGYEVLFEREAQGSNQVRVTWKDEKGISGSVLAPIIATRTPIWEDEIYNLSDLLFYLLGISPVKIPRSSRDTESEMVRLSFRDLMWYCYLEQERLDSSFFNLEIPIIQRKSRYVMRFIVGAYTERLNELEMELLKIRELKLKREEEVNQLRSFLRQFGYGSEKQILEDIDNTNVELKKASSELSKMRDGYVKDTHFVDNLRNDLRFLDEQVAKEERTLIDLEKRIAEQESLRAELFTTKFKLARSESAKDVLQGVTFEYCPSCGLKLRKKTEENDVCPLCNQKSSEANADTFPLGEIVRLDLDSRIKELEESIERHRRAYADEKRSLVELEEKKSLGDLRLEEELKNYDSKFLSYSRETERQIAALDERIRSLQKILAMPRAVNVLEDEAVKLSIDEEKVKREISEEKEKLDTAGKLIGEIEESYLHSLLAIGVPGVCQDDQVRINRTTWIPDILPHGMETGKWNFYNAGSAGKKTLLNVCFALSVHRVASQHNLPLPTFLIIDTPMKNIGEDVNREIFESFYYYLYDLTQGPLIDTQLIIIDKEYFSPIKEVEIFDRYMTTDDDKHPPLISYYRGP